MSSNTQQCPSCGEHIPTEYVTCIWCSFDLSAEHIRRSGITIGRKEALRRVIKVARSPVEAFKEISLIPELKGGRLILLGIGFLITLHLLVIFGKMDGISFNEDPIYLSLADASVTTFTVISTNVLLWFISKLPTIFLLILSPLFFLFIFTVALRWGTRFVLIFSRILGGGSDKQKTRAAIGYSLTPVLIGYLITLPLRLFSPSTIVSQSTYTEIQSAIEKMDQSGIGVFINILMIISWIWATVLAIIGVGRATKLPVIESTIATGIPFGVLLIILI